jgi:hypothetical protein
MGKVNEANDSECYTAQDPLDSTWKKYLYVYLKHSINNSYFTFTKKN